MKIMLKAIVSLFLLFMLFPANATAYIGTLESDAHYINLRDSGKFTKIFGGNVRWGISGPGDWEYSVVDGNDLPLDHQEYEWGTGQTHSYQFGYIGQNASLQVSDATMSQANILNYLGGYTINALAIRAKASGGDVAKVSSPITITFQDNSTLLLPDLVGDSDAQYHLIVDGRLGQGFTVSGSADLFDGSRSNPMYGFKVGYSTVPIPGAALLFVPGLGLFAWMRKRKA